MQSAKEWSPDIVTASTPIKRLPRKLWLDPDTIDPEAATSNALTARRTGRFSSNLRSAYNKVSGAIGSAAQNIRSALPSAGASGFEPLSAQEDDPETLHYKQTDDPLPAGPKWMGSAITNSIKQIAVYVLVIVISVTVGIVIGHYSDSVLSPNQPGDGGVRSGALVVPSHHTNWRVNDKEKMIRIERMKVPDTTEEVQMKWIPGGVTLTEPHDTVFVPKTPSVEASDAPGGKRSERDLGSKHHLINRAIGVFADAEKGFFKVFETLRDEQGKRVPFNQKTLDKYVESWKFDGFFKARDELEKEVRSHDYNLNKWKKKLGMEPTKSQIDEWVQSQVRIKDSKQKAKHKQSLLKEVNEYQYQLSEQDVERFPWLKYEDNRFAAENIAKVKWAITGFMMSKLKKDELSAVVNEFADEVCDGYQTLKMDNLPLWYTKPLPLRAASKEYKVFYPKYWMDGPMVEYYFEEVLKSPYGPEGVRNEENFFTWRKFKGLMNHVHERLKSLPDKMEEIKKEGIDMMIKEKGS